VPGKKIRTDLPKSCTADTDLKFWLKGSAGFRNFAPYALVQITPLPSPQSTLTLSTVVKQKF